MVNLNINGKPVEVEDGTTILDAAKKINIKIPTLCYCADLSAWGSCGVCVIKNVAPNGAARMARACTTVCEPNMNIITHDAEINSTRKTVVEMILANHPKDCLSCARNQNCELQSVAAEFGIRQSPFAENINWAPVDASYEEVVFERYKCISCGRCVKACQEMQNVWALEYNNRGDQTIIGPAAGTELGSSPCVRCGQCASHCPVGAITTHNPVEKIAKAIQDPEITPVVSIAPSIRSDLGEEFGLPYGSITTGKIYTALRMLGFKHVFDTNFAADMTIMEEGTELIQRLTKGTGPLPMFTSCCPAWVDYAEKRYHDMLPHLSTAKSPQAMQGALTKNVWAEEMCIKADKIFHLSIMPCTAKAWEARRNKDMYTSGAADTDLVITTREFAQLIKEAGIDFANLPESGADSPLGPYSGAGTIFGATGGVMEAALRTAYALVEGKEMPNPDYMPARGLEGVKEAALTLGGKEVRIAIIHQLGNVDAVIQKIRGEITAGKEPSYHFIEIMACRGGCVAGGGQPYGPTDEIRLLRAKALYTDDKDSKVRCSHDNPLVKEMYSKHLGAPCGEKSHHLLHTHYEKRELFA
ncbi:MAG: [FeFe] hydrogenase, group A [Spirochaetaceae bacterium]|jgi:NADH-quinone oxidoreductase subunit G|nr:[FeFe] hydrogenase, group A [Spirochaetaceae bacterium]